MMAESRPGTGSVLILSGSESKDEPLLQPIRLSVTEERIKPKTNRAYNSPEMIQGVIPLFLTSQTQALFKLVIGEHVTTEIMYRMIPKSDLISDMQTRLAISDFTPYKKDILAFRKEELLLHYDPEYKYGQNFFMAITQEGLILYNFSCG
jgi:hypothetical protein